MIFGDLLPGASVFLDANTLERKTERKTGQNDFRKSF
jgi:hypothetical protein